jgi:hypothetical protein
VDIENIKVMQGVRVLDKIIEAVLKKSLELVEMPLVQVAISLKCPASWLVAQTYPGVHLSVYWRSEIACPPRYLARHKHLQL